MSGTTSDPSVRLRSAATVIAMAVLLATLAYAGYWLATGGHWFVVRTPSMGTAAPVGTLLWVRPVAFGELHVGDLITFHPPGLHTTYSHRVYALDGDGTLSTKGDANSSPDLWRLHAGDIVGRVTTRWWGVGFLVRALPLLMIGALVLALLLHRWTAPKLRLPAGIVGLSFLLSLALYLFRPLVGAQQIATLPTDPGIRATYIGTGLFPLRLYAEGGGHVDLRAGQLGTVSTSHANADGRYSVGLLPLIPWWCWVVLIGTWFVPAVWTSCRRRRRYPTTGRHESGSGRDQRPVSTRPLAAV